MVVVQDHVCIFEVNECVRAVRIQTQIAVCVFALVAREDDLLLLVRLHFAARLGLGLALLPRLRERGRFWLHEVGGGLCDYCGIRSRGLDFVH